MSSKIGVLDHLIDSADTLIIGGGMAYTFFLAKGYAVGTSLKEEDWIERAGEMPQEGRGQGRLRSCCPSTTSVADHFGEDAVGEVVDSDKIPADRMGMDIGPKTEALYTEAIAGAKTVFWNGPMGVFEMDQFAHGTEAVARAVADSDCTSIIGGGRLRGRYQQVRPGRQDELDLHRRWRLHGARRGQGPSRSGGSERCRVTAPASSQATGR